MDVILQAFLNDPSALNSRRVEQVVAICGNGTLSDDSDCSRGFREFLKNLPSKILKKYSAECLDGTMQRNQNSGLILQDLVNEVGDRLGFQCEPGFYRGSPSRIGHDGLWLSADFSFVVEVKTSDLSIKLDTIADYRQKLIDSNRVAEAKSSILIVLGRQDTGDLEAQIRGSRHAWDIRMIGIESLFRLLDIKENLNDPRSILQITELLKPIEYTRVDKLIDAVFFTSWDISTPETPEPHEVDADNTKATPRDVEPTGDDRRTHSSPVNFYEECLSRINHRLGKNFIKNGRVTYSSADKLINIVLLNSKSYIDPRGRSFWYGFRPNQAEFLDDSEEAFVAFGCGSEDLILLIPYSEFKEWVPKMGSTLNDDGELVHRHVVILESDGRYSMRVGDDYVNVTEHKLQEPQQGGGLNALPRVSHL
jgi:hypothetical protein